MVFTVAGFLMMAFLYVSKSGGNVVTFLSDPISIVYVVFPFIPAMIFSRISSKAESNLKKMYGDPADKKADDKKETPMPAADAKKEPPKDAKDAKEPKKDAKETKK